MKPNGEGAKALAFCWIDRRERFASVVVTGTRDTDAVVDIPFQIDIDREGVRA